MLDCSQFEAGFEIFEEMRKLENDVANSNQPEDDIHSLRDSDMQALEAVIDTPPTNEAEEPPSSILRLFEDDSMCAELFDANLQYSSPCTSGTAVECNENFDVLSVDSINWDEVFKCENGRLECSEHKKTTQPSEPCDPGVEKCLPTSVDSISSSYVPPSSWTAAPLLQCMMLKPFRTCFHVDEIVKAKSSMFRNQDNAVFELFARVVYSSRDNFFRKQYFQFSDLFIETPPYLTGVLDG